MPTTTKTNTPTPEVLRTCVICGHPFALGKWAKPNRKLCEREACFRLHQSATKAASYRRTHTPMPQLKPMLLGGHADEPENAI